MNNKFFNAPENNDNDNDNKGFQLNDDKLIIIVIIVFAFIIGSLIISFIVKDSKKEKDPEPKTYINTDPEIKKEEPEEEPEEKPEEKPPVVVEKKETYKLSCKEGDQYFSYENIFTFSEAANGVTEFEMIYHINNYELDKEAYGIEYKKVIDSFDFTLEIIDHFKLENNVPGAYLKNKQRNGNTYDVDVLFVKNEITNLELSSYIFDGTNKYTMESMYQIRDERPEMCQIS